MAEGHARGDAPHFLITHFFNPVRYMRLLEVVAGPDTDPRGGAGHASFGESALGKGIVYGKDTPNFVANRIGTFGMGSVFRHMRRIGLPIETVDKVFGSAMGRPKSAVFRTADLVGLDTLVHVFGTVYDNCPDDEERDAFVVPDFLTQLVESGRTGAKTGAGFYKKVKQAGKSEILGLDLDTLEYRSAEKQRFKSLGAAKKADDPAKAIAAMLASDDEAAQLAWAVTADTLIYAANRIPEIADDIVNIDRAMRWGFGWDLGPFQTWDAIGVAASVARMKEEGRTVPAWVEAMLAAGRESFYARNGEGDLTYWAATGGVGVVETSPRHLHIVDLKAKNREIARNASASLLDMGDGCGLLEFHSKMNALDTDIGNLYNDALDRLDAGELEALVVGNQDGRAFCAGANIFVILIMASQGQWDDIDAMLRGLQDTVQRAKYSARPVVTAPYGLALGGGSEVAMQATAAVAHGDLFQGQVEVGVGVIPAAGGCKELLFRYLGDIPQHVDYDPNPAVQKIFELVGLGKVTGSAEEARDLGYLRPTDKVVLDIDSLLHEAKRTALGLAAAGWTPPRKGRTIKLPGRQGAAAIELALLQMKEGGYASDHDVFLGKQLARVLTGGDIPSGATRTEQDILDLEREAFLSAVGTPKTLERIQHMLQTGKPLRN